MMRQMKGMRALVMVAIIVKMRWVAMIVMQFVVIVERMGGKSMI